MMFETICGIDLDLRKLGIAVGVWDIISMVFEIVLELEEFSGRSDNKEILDYKISFQMETIRCSYRWRLDSLPLDFS